MDLLMPLRIPQSYAICYNKFYDVIPISQNNDIYLENIWYFTEDILQICKMDIDINGNHYIPEEPLIIDLGWYPDGKSNGSYTLKLALAKKDYGWESIKVCKTRDRIEIKDTLEEWLQEYLSYRYDTPE